MRTAFNLRRSFQNLHVPNQLCRTFGTVTQDKLLFTPGPLTTSLTTKMAATRDLGSRDVTMMDVIRNVREQTTLVGGMNPDEYTMVPIQGSGTFAVEATVSTLVEKNGGHLGICSNGAYGHRLTLMCEAQGIPYTHLSFPENVQVDPTAVANFLDENPEITMFACVESETTSGVVNDIAAIGPIVKSRGKGFIVDAMSSFPIWGTDYTAAGADAVVSSANKCIEGIPGFAFSIVKRSLLAERKGNARSLVLDLHAQAAGLDGSGQFRFTPPTHCLLAFNQALLELEQEGGPQARRQRYQENRDILHAGIAKLGFSLYLPSELQGPIISSIKYPTDPNWDFARFYQRLSDLGFVIYPGKVGDADCFRIGHIGHLQPQDVEALNVAMETVCKELGTACFYQAQ